MESKALKEVFLEKNILDEKFTPMSNYSRALRTLMAKVKVIDHGRIVFEYYISLLVTIIFIYRSIFFEFFSKIYYQWIFAILILWLFGVILASGLIAYIQKRITHALDILYSETPNVQLKDSIGKKKMKLADILGLQFAKIEDKDSVSEKQH